MWIADGWRDYELLDCGGVRSWSDGAGICWCGRTPRPSGPPWGGTRLDPARRRYFRSSTGGGHWDKGKLPAQWQIRYRNLTFQVKPMNFKHTGIFPEQAVNWDFAMEAIRRAGGPSVY